jgi:hypothetical protein
MKAKLLRKENINKKRETLFFATTINVRIPIAKVGHVHLSKKDRERNKRVKVTINNYDKI